MTLRSERTRHNAEGLRVQIAAGGCAARRVFPIEVNEDQLVQGNGGHPTDTTTSQATEMSAVHQRPGGPQTEMKSTPMLICLVETH